MTNIKKELHKKIGHTEVQKARAWQKLQQPKKKKPTSLWIGVAFVAVLLLFMTSLLKETRYDTAQTRQNDDSQTHTSEDREGVLFTVLTEKSGKPDEMHNDYAIFVATTEQQYEQYVTLFNVEKNPIDFSTNNVVFAQFISDGCGLVVEEIYVDGNRLKIELELPVDLRDNAELACTAIASANTVVLQTEKIVVNSGTFIEGDREITTTFNEYEVFEQEEPLITGYIVGLTDTEMLVTRNNESIHLQRVENVKIDIENAITFSRHPDAELGDYVFIFGEANSRKGTIREIQIEKEITVHGASSVVQTFVKKALLEEDVQQMQTPFIAMAYFDMDKKLWEIQVVDGANPEHKRVYTYHE